MKKHCLKYILLLICSIHFAVSANTYKFRGITMADGLSDLLVNVIYKDSSGYIWLGTDKGLDRFDGVNIRQYSFNTTDTQRGRLYAITGKNNNGLWIGNDLGLWQLDQFAESPQQIEKNTIDFPVYSLLNRDGVLYIGTERGLYIHTEKGLAHVLTDKNVFSSSNKIKGITADKAGTIWLASVKGLYSYRPDSGELVYHPVKPALAKGEEFRNITILENSLYIGTEGQGVLRYDIESAIFHHFVNVGNGIISSLSTDGKDLIYISTDGSGIHFLSHEKEEITESFVHDTKDRGSIRSNSVYSLLVDKQGIIWAGFYQAGFDYSLYQNGLFQVYSYPPYFDTMDLTVRSFYIHNDEKLIGTRDGLFYIDEKRGIVKSFRVPQLRSNLILSLCRYDNKYYIGTYGGGLSILDVNNFTLTEFANDELFTFHNGHIFCLKPGPEGDLWMGTSAGVYRYNKESGELKVYNNSNAQMPEGNVYEIYFDSTGKGWICTEYGLCLYDPESKSMKSNIFPDNFPHRDKYRIVYEDDRSNIYILPDKGSMVITDILLSKCERMEMHPVIHGNAYMSIQQDDLGWFWLGCDDGILRRRDDSYLYDAFNFSDGIPSQTFLNPSFKDDKGILWFSNAKGLLYVDPLRVDEIRRTYYNVVFTDILLNGESLPVTGKQDIMKNKALKLKRNQNNLSFHFANLTYSDPATTVYEYKLEGSDADWKLLTGKNDISYYGLPVGKYTFRIRIPGNQSSESVVAVHIQSSFTWGLALSILIVIGLVIANVLYIKARRKKEEAVIDIEKEKEEEPETENMAAISQPKKDEEKYKTKRLSEQECELLYKRLQEYIQENRPYTNSELKLADLAKGLNISSHSLSYLFNQYIKQSYYDFVNVYRIEEFKKLSNDAEYARYTLTALAELCGFNSRASFFRSFKKYTGITPNEYINSLRKNEEEK